MPLGNGWYGGGNMTPLCSRVVHFCVPSPTTVWSGSCSHHLWTSSASSSFSFCLPLPFFVPFSLGSSSAAFLPFFKPFSSGSSFLTLPFFLANGFAISVSEPDSFFTFLDVDFLTG